MNDWTTALQRGLVGGAASSVLSSMALAALGKGEGASAYASTNAVSHWIWGDEAFGHEEPNVRHTATGYLIHHASATFWSVIFERLCGHLLDRKEPALTLGVGVAAAGVACFADYQLTPERLRPGYEEHLSKPSLALVYGSFGLGLALGAMLCRRSGAANR